MPQLLTHPPLDTLRAYALGKLTAADATAVEEHITVCAECGRILSEQPDDSFQRLARKAAPAESAPDGATGGFVQSADPDRTIPPEAPPADPAGTIPPNSPDGDTAAGGQRDRTIAGARRPVAGVPPELADHPRYRVVKVLGEGGMGAVYAAEHLKMDRKVALKVIHAHLISRGDALPRFLQEVRAAAKLSHPNIVQAYDADEAGDMHFLVMEYVEGTDLAKFLQKKGPLPVNLACHFVRQAALGLQHAHEQGMIHRDIKPHNLMLTPKGQVKILDFGLARFAKQGGPADGQLTGTGVVMGTADYIAPEQTKDARTIDIRADIYSLGCTLYQLLTGRVPFPDGSVIDKMIKHALETPPDLAGLRPDLPAELVRVIERMMAKNPDDRFATPADVARALTPFVTSKPANPIPTAAEAAATADPQPSPFEVLTDEDTDPGATRPADPRPAPVGRRSRPRAPAPRRPWWKAPWAIATAAAGVFALIAAGVAVYRIQTDHGELVIETSCDDVDVLVKQNGKVVSIIDTRTNKTVTLRGGKYELGLELGKDGKPRDDVTIDVREAEIKRGGKVIAVVRRVPKAAPVARVPSGDAPKTDPNPPPKPKGGSATETAGPGSAQLTDQARAALDAGSFNQAIDLATRAIALDPSAAEPRVVRGLAYGRTGRWKELQEEMDVVVRLAPERHDGWQLRGWARMNLPALPFGAAMEDFTRSIEWKPDGGALSDRGAIRFWVGDYAGAAADWSEALRLNPGAELRQRGWWHRARGFARLRLGDAGGAAADEKEALILYPEVDKNPYLAPMRTDAAAAKAERAAFRATEGGDHAKAIELADEALKADPKYAPALRTRGLALCRMKKWDDGEKDFSAALASEPHNREALDLRSWARLHKPNPDYQGCIADATRALEVGHPAWFPYINRGLARAQLGEYRAAAADYDLGLARMAPTAPERAWEVRVRGYIRERAGDLAGARTDEQEALKLDPKVNERPNPLLSPAKKEPAPVASAFDSKVLFRELRRFGPNDAVVRKGAVSPDGTLVAASLNEGDGGDSYLGVFEVAGGRRVLKEALFIHDLAWGPDKMLYVFALHDGGNRLLRFDLKDPNPRPTSLAAQGALEANLGGRDVAVSPDGSRIAVHDALADKRGRVTVYDPSGKELARFQGGPIPATDFKEFGPGLATWRGSMARETARAHHLSALAFSPDGKLLACAHADRTLRVWDVTNKREAWKLPGLTNSGAGVSFPAGDKLVVGGGGQGLKVVNPQTGKAAFVLADAPKPQQLPGGVKIDVPGFDPAFFGSFADTGLVRCVPIPTTKTLLGLSLTGGWKVFGADGRAIDVDGPNRLFGTTDVRLIGFTPDGRHAVVCYLTDSDDLQAQKRGGGLRDAPGQLGLWDVNPILTLAK